MFLSKFTRYVFICMLIGENNYFICALPKQSCLGLAPKVKGPVYGGKIDFSGKRTKINKPLSPLIFWNMNHFKGNWIDMDNIISLRLF